MTDLLHTRLTAALYFTSFNPLLALIMSICHAPTQKECQPAEGYTRNNCHQRAPCVTPALEGVQVIKVSGGENAAGIPLASYIYARSVYLCRSSISTVFSDVVLR